MSGVTTSLVVCPKCKSKAQRIGSFMTNPLTPIYGCAACRHEWSQVDAEPTLIATDTHCTHEGRSFLKPCPVCTLPKTPAEKALERDEERREERHQMDVLTHKMNVEVMRKQLVDITDVAIHRAKLLHHVQRQTEALEGILRFLRESREEDLNRSRVVMD